MCGCEYGCDGQRETWLWCLLRSCPLLFRLFQTDFQWPGAYRVDLAGSYRDLLKSASPVLGLQVLSSMFVFFIFYIKNVIN